MSRPDSLPILGYGVYNDSTDYFSDGVTGVVSTLNPHSYVIARRDRLFREALRQSDILLPDGVGIQLAARVLEGKAIKKIAGSDLHDLVIAALDKRGGSCLYLGSSEETLQRISARLTLESPRVRAGFHSPPFREHFTAEENDAMIKVVNAFDPDVLFVGMTAPKQEKWVYENRERLNVPLICCIGAAFDFYAGTVKRPGNIWIRIGLEWMPRLLREPRRLWKRNLVSTPLFLWYLLIEKFRHINARRGNHGESQR